MEDGLIQVRVIFSRNDTARVCNVIERITMSVPNNKKSIAEEITRFKRGYANNLGIKESRIDARIMRPPLPDSASVTVQLNGKKRNIIWQALYSKRATGYYNDKPKDAKLVEEIMDSMRVI